MTVVAVLGAGGGGLSATVELTLAGSDVVLWNRNPRTLAPYSGTGEIPYEGVLGRGRIEPRHVTTNLEEALSVADVAMICLPSLAHRALFNDLAMLRTSLPVILNPGHTGAALHARHVWRQHGTDPPPIAEFSTLTYVARVGADAVVNTTGRASTVRAACLPGGVDALDWAQALFPTVTVVEDVLASSLSNVNLVLHPPGAILGLSWIESSGGDFTFYVEGMTQGVIAVMMALDSERLAVAKAVGHELLPLAGEMAAIGTVSPEVMESGDLGSAIRSGSANQAIRAPGSISHRYFQEDLPFGLLPFVTLAEITATPVPTARALLALGSILIEPSSMAAGLNRRHLGLQSADLEELIATVR